jgi:phage tail-like protein
MARSGNLDELTKFRYTVYIRVDGSDEFIKKLSFMSVSAPRVDIATTQYREGGRHLNPHSITESATFSPVTFRRGKSYSNDFINWIGMVFRAFYGDQDGNSSNYRATIAIDHHDRRGNVVKKYVLQNARPTMYLPSGDFNAMDDQEVSIESLTVEYEGYAEFSLDQNFLANVLGSSGSELLSRVRGTDSPTSLKAGIPDTF